MSHPYEENPFNTHNSDSHAPLVTAALSTSISTSPPPAWLAEEKTPSDFQSRPSAEQQSNSNTAAGDVDPAVPRMILYSRVINLLLSVCMIVASLLSLLTTDNATTGVLACYVVVFSCLICCFETHMKLISKMIALNFGFMYSAKSRSAFMIFVGTILFSFSLFGKIVGVLMLANAGFNIFVLVKFKGYDEAQRVAAQADIQDFLAQHSPAFANQMSLVTAGTSFVLSNPEMVKKGAEAYMALPSAKNSENV